MCDLFSSLYNIRNLNTPSGPPFESAASILGKALCLAAGCVKISRITACSVNHSVNRQCLAELHIQGDILLFNYYSCHQQETLSYGMSILQCVPMVACRSCGQSPSASASRPYLVASSYCRSDQPSPLRPRHSRMKRLHRKCYRVHGLRGLGQTLRTADANLVGAESSLRISRAASNDLLHFRAIRLPHELRQRVPNSRPE